MMARALFHFLAIAILFSPVASGQQGDIPLSREINFLQDKSCGSVWIGAPLERSNVVDGFMDRQPAETYIGVARGAVTVPAAATVELRIDGKTAGDLRFLGSLPTDAIHSLVFKGAKIHAADLTALAKISSLHTLEFESCTFAVERQWQEFAGIPSLKQLSARDCQLDEKQRQLLLQWAARCKNLNEIYGEVAPKRLEDLQLFEHHPAPLALSVELESNASEWMTALNRIPSLAVLNLSVTPNAPEEYWHGLRSVHGLQALSIETDREFTADFMDELSSMAQLRTLVLNSAKPITADCVRKLRQLRALERLSLPGYVGINNDEYNAIIVGMPKLREFYGLQTPRLAELKSLGRRNDIERLEIIGLGTDATVADLAAIVASNPLTSLELRKIPLDGELGTAICSARQLKQLTLEADRVDCRHFKRWSDLPHLARVEFVAHKATAGLEALRDLPSLTNLEISVPTFDAEQFYFIGSLKKLQQLVIHKGVIDDQVAEQLVNCQELRTLQCLSDCVLTDRGFELLLRCPKLDFLSVGGFLSRASVERALVRPEKKHLFLSTDQIGEQQVAELVRQYGSRVRLTIRPLDMFGHIETDRSGMWREAGVDGRAALDAIEGKQLSELLGQAMTEQLTEQLANKVVLVDFWGVWCGPCLGYKPELLRLHEKFANDGFEILAIHSQQGADDIEQYRQNNPRDPWIDIIDSSGVLAKSFAISRYPAFYLVDRQGKLRVAQPHRLGMERAIRHYLEP